MGRTCSGEMASASLVGPPEMEAIRSSCMGKVVLRGKVVGGVMGACMATGCGCGVGAMYCWTKGCCCGIY
jgi:hypothetical protein